MLFYAKKLTKKPAAVQENDIEKSKELQLSDKDILDLNQGASYFNYVKRTADGLEIELEDFYKDL